MFIIEKFYVRQIDYKLWVFFLLFNKIVVHLVYFGKAVDFFFFVIENILVIKTYIVTDNTSVPTIYKHIASIKQVDALIIV